MAAIHDIYRKDLATRFPTYTFTKTSPGSREKYVVKDGSNNVILRISTRGNTIGIVRENLVGGTDILPTLTTAQRNNIIGAVKNGTQILNLTANVVQTRSGGAWI